VIGVCGLSDPNVTVATLSDVETCIVMIDVAVPGYPLFQPNGASACNLNT
jgi:hypothetical protein